MITHLFTCQVSFFEQLLQSQMVVNRTSRNWVCHQHRSRCFWHFLAKVGWGYRCETAHFFAPQYPQQQRTKGIPTNVYTPKTRLLAIQEPTKITHLHYHPEKKKGEQHGKTWKNMEQSHKKSHVLGLCHWVPRKVGTVSSGGQHTFSSRHLEFPFSPHRMRGASLTQGSHFIVGFDIVWIT